jgi:hypothetical protein
VGEASWVISSQPANSSIQQNPQEPAWILDEMMVARDGVEPPTPAFSGLDSLGLNPFSVNNLIRQGGHSFVTIL